MKKISAKTVCRIAALSALYFLLNMISVRAGNLRITFASLPVVVCALLTGPAEAALTAVFGELLNQLLSYGVSATTALWLIPPAVRGVVIGLAALWAHRSGRELERRIAACYAVCVAAALCTTLTNTLVIWLDSVLYGYYTPVYVFGDLAVRLVTGTVTAVIVAMLAAPLTALLRRQVLLQKN